MKSFLSLIESCLKEDNTEDRIIDFFAENPSPEDSQIHALADELGIEHSEFESKIYKILSDFFSSGRWNAEGQPDVDPDQLAAGTEIEYEHTSSKKFAERIAKDHLSEIKDYYTRLKKMEDDADEVKESVIFEAEEETAEEIKDKNASTITNADGENQEESDVDTEEGEVSEEEKEKGIADKFIWNIECYTILGIRQIFVYASNDRISYDTYKATPEHLLMYVNKKYGRGTFGEDVKHLDTISKDVSSIELVLDNDGLNKEVIDFISELAEQEYNFKVSIV